MMKQVYLVLRTGLFVGRSALRLSQPLGVLVILLIAGVPSAALADPVIEQALRTRIEALGRPGGGNIDGHRIAAKKLLPKLYDALGFKLAWQDPAAMKALQTAVARSWEDGLIASDFHDETVAAALPAPDNAEALADRDIILSDAFSRLVYQLYFGKVDPHGLDGNWNFSRPVLESDPATALAKAINAGKIDELIERARLKHPFYLALKATLQAYTQHAIDRLWVSVADGPPLKPGDKDPRVGGLRARLAVTGEYQETQEPADPLQYDPALVESLKRFQAANSLEDDGVVGPATIKVLNATPEDRIQQLRVNLERARWILRDVGNELVLVNIAGFYLRLVLDGKPVWKTRVVVGKTYHKTPVFTENMKTIVFNPDWSLPRSIVRGEKFAKMSRNPGYVAANDYELRDGSGKRVNPQTINWASYSAKTFPYGMVQKPGPKNALGIVKFLFPNKYAVYLHDTPSRQLFGKAARTFSHGCIRVEDPLKLAELILANRKGWDRTKIDALVATGKTQYVKVAPELPVLLLYWTADPTFDGGAHFYPDIYGRDARLLKALDAPFDPERLQK